MTKVKICGIQTVVDALSSIEAGADFIGLNFVRESPRYVSFERAKSIVEAVRSNKLSKAKIVGVFRNSTFEYVNMFSDCLGLDYVQLHGDECPTYIKLMHSPVIKAFNLPSDFNLTTVINRFKRFKVDYYLIDREKQGSGEMLNLKKVDRLCKQFPIIFSGGLTTDNLQYVLKNTSPLGIDVASGIETGNKIDNLKMFNFINKSKFINL